MVASTDYMRAFAEQIRPYVPVRFVCLGTDGFGRSESRASLREFFEVDYRYIVVATLAALMRDGKIAPAVVEQAMKTHNISADKSNPAIS